MATAMSPPSAHGNRPAYLDKLFHEAPLSPPTLKSPRLRSTKSSISSLNSELHANEGSASQQWPDLEADAFDDRMSVRSLKLHLSPRFRIRNLLNKRSYPHVQETVEYDSARPMTSHAGSPPRLPPLPKLHSAFQSPSRKGHQSKAKIVPSVPCSKAERLHCTPCYYFAARNCHGYVWGGDHGDACENCAASGFFGAP